MKLVTFENITKYNELLNKKIVKSVNSVKPDSNGNVTLEIPQAIGVTKFPDYEHPITVFDVVNKGFIQDVNFDYVFPEDGYFHYRLLATEGKYYDAIIVGSLTVNGNVVDLYERSMSPAGSGFWTCINNLIPVPKGSALHIGFLQCDADANNVIEFFPLKNGNAIQADEVTGVVKSVNSIAPDENGNVQIDISDADLSGVVKSVNSIAPDESGNVDITIPEVDLSGMVKSVNNIHPDESGSVTLEIPSTDGMVKSINSVKPDSNGNVDITIPKPITNIVGVTDNRNLGEIFYSALPQTSSQVHSLDGSVLTDATELYDYLESIKDSNPDLFTTDSEFNSEVESTGKCSKFVINTDTKSVRIPKADLNNYIVIKSFDKKFEFNQPFSLLEPKWSDVPLNNPSWLLSNGQENSQENYPSVYELLLNEYNNGTLKSETISDVSISFKQLDNGHKVVTDKTAYNSILVKTGTAWYYLLDLDSRTFVLPQTNGYMKYGNSNQFVKQSLPNIKGQTGYTVTSGDDETIPPFSKIYTSPYGAPSATANLAKFAQIGFDASTYSDIYADDANVNPNSVQGYLYFYVGECVGTSNSVNLGDIKDKLDLDIANLKTELNKLKGNISTLAFPSEKNVVLTIPASNTTLTAPANGWFVYQSVGGGTTNDYMFMSDTTTEYYGCQTRDLVGRGLYVSCPAKKGESVYFEWIDSGTTRKLKFVYATDQDIEE